MSLPLEIALITCSPKLPKDVLPQLQNSLELLEACDYETLLSSELAKRAVAIPEGSFPDDWATCVSQNIDDILSSDGADQKATVWELLLLGIACLNTFLQANATGPPLLFGDRLLLPTAIAQDAEKMNEASKNAIRRLSVDGEEAYHLTTYVFVLTLGKVILNHPLLAKSEEVSTTLPWWRARGNFLHQKVLTNPTTTLHNSIYADYKVLESTILQSEDQNIDKWTKARYLMEKAIANNYYSYDAKAKKALEDAAVATGLMYAMTGRMGKRTKFQTDDISQLVLLARSKDQWTKENEEAKPKSLDLNDDTLLDDISFTPNTSTIVDEDHLPKQLTELSLDDPPTLNPLDATILLLLAETIKNTSPADGITREQMLPYTERVLKHATNWSVYTLGLLVRSRLEGYRSRTVERSVLQMQVVVDQIVAETTRPDDWDGKTGAKTFLPRPTEQESAPVAERLRYIYQLPVPTRWEVESELAARWTHFGAMKTALDIYERLEMWPEVALCWGAVDKEEKGKEIIRALLFEGPMPKPSDYYDEEDREKPATNGNTDTPRKERDPPPPEAPRLWCILGDIEHNPDHYIRAWEVSGNRFARAQRSLGKYYHKNKELDKAVKAYALSLKINAINHSCWFSYGCALLELEQWNAAVEAFSRVVSLDDSDAEGWNNLASALLHREPKPKETNGTTKDSDEEQDTKDEEERRLEQREKNKRDALTALKRAARIKPESWRIWENILIIACSTTPASYNDVCTSLRRIIDLRGKSAGETCIDVEILDHLVNHVIRSDEEYDPEKPGLNRMVVDLVDNCVVPLITADPKLWGIVARLYLWRKKPSAALESHEKAFRAVSNTYDVRQDSDSWKQLVDWTEDLADAYESLGPRERTEGLGAGEGAIVMKDWKFKTKSTIRGVMGKGRKLGWDMEDASAWGKLKELMERFK